MQLHVVSLEPHKKQTRRKTLHPKTHFLNYDSIRSINKQKKKGTEEIMWKTGTKDIKIVILFFFFFVCFELSNNCLWQAQRIPRADVRNKSNQVLDFNLDSKKKNSNIFVRRSTVNEIPKCSDLILYSNVEWTDEEKKSAQSIVGRQIIPSRLDECALSLCINAHSVAAYRLGSYNNEHMIYAVHIVYYLCT